MEEMKIATIAQEMTRYTRKFGRPEVEPKHIVKLPDNKYSEPISPEVYAARANDLTIVANLWPDGTLSFNIA